jgi:peroxiredoxin
MARPRQPKKVFVTGLYVIIALGLVFSGFGSWLIWQLLRQNGRMLLRIEALEQWLEEFHLEGQPSSNGKTNSLARSRINRDGLKAGTVAPAFRLPRIDGGELSREEFRGRRVLLTFSDPQCGPCNYLAPQLEKFHRENPEIGVVMISRRDVEANRAKVREHGLTFPVVLQKQWEISRLYGMFATPIAYLIDEAGIVAHDVAVGVESIVELMKATATVTPDVKRFELTDCIKSATNEMHPNNAQHA